MYRFFASLFLLYLTVNSYAQHKYPNVIVILSDDHGYGDISAHGNPILRTPALDHLRSESVSFENFHATPVCTPTRGELMTGLDALRNQASMVPSGRNIMRRDIFTMPQIFRDNGYSTGIFGKWHLGNTYPDRPLDRGFQRAVWHKGWGLSSEIEFDNDYYRTRYIDQEETKYSGRYCTDLWFNSAKKWMDEQLDQGKSFFCYLSLNAAHGPYFAKPEDRALYSKLVDNEPLASFYGMMHNIDQNMAALDKWLQEKGVKNNTILIYMNDNGATIGTEVYNSGMRGRKGSNYEGGHRTICFFRYPGFATSNSTTGFPSRIADVLPTLIDVIGLKYNGNDFDGISLRPFLLGQTTRHDRMFVVQYGGRSKPSKYFGCVVYNQWRLVGENELFRLDEDPGQEKNVLTQYPDIAQKMKGFYEQWWKTVEPFIDDVLPIIVDPEYENPVVVTSNSWREVDVENVWSVSLAKGDPKGGEIKLRFEEAGTYRIELSRWPFHLAIPLTNSGPQTTVGGAPITHSVWGGWSTPLLTSVALPISRSILILGKERFVKSIQYEGETNIAFEVDIPIGEKMLQGWFEDSQDHPLCGAYYIRIKKI